MSGSKDIKGISAEQKKNLLKNVTGLERMASIGCAHVGHDPPISLIKKWADEVRAALKKL